MRQFIDQQHHVAPVQIGVPVLDLHLLYYLQHYRSFFVLLKARY